MTRSEIVCRCERSSNPSNLSPICKQAASRSAPGYFDWLPGGCLLLVNMSRRVPSVLVCSGAFSMPASWRMFYTGTLRLS